MNIIAKEDQATVADNFWIMLQELESKAESENDIVLKYWVEQWYSIFNRFRNDVPKTKPRWIKE